MTEPEHRAAEIFALRSVRDTHVIFSIAEGISGTSRFFEKVGEHAVSVPLARANELSRMLLDTEETLIEVGHTSHSSRTIAFHYRNVMLTPTGQAVLRAVEGV